MNMPVNAPASNRPAGRYAETTARCLQEMDGYDPAVYHRLSRFHLAKKAMAAQQENVLELGRLIRRHGLEQRIGVNLLHKHFDLLTDEILVRRFRDGGASISPAKRRRVTKVVPYLWQFARGVRGAGFYPLEFSSLPAKHVEAATADVQEIAQAEEFLREMGALLRRLRVTRVFGIASLYAQRLFEVSDGETMLERTDEVHRVLSLEPIVRTELEGLESTQTLWVFRDPA